MGCNERLRTRKKTKYTFCFIQQQSLYSNVFFFLLDSHEIYLDTNMFRVQPKMVLLHKQSMQMQNQQFSELVCRFSNTQSTFWADFTSQVWR